MNALVRLLFGGDRLDVVVECRRCGTTLSPSTDRCPQCDSDSIATYHVG